MNNSIEISSDLCSSVLVIIQRTIKGPATICGKTCATTTYEDRSPRPNARLTRADPATSIDFITGTWVSPADPRIDPEERAGGNLSTSRAIVDAWRPYHWRDQFPEGIDPSPELTRQAQEKFSYLLE